MNLVFEHYQKHFDTISTLVQSRNSDDAQRREFLSEFFDHDETLGFAIMGGVFAEGIDYQGQSLIGAIIVGVGLPQANRKRPWCNNFARPPFQPGGLSTALPATLADTILSGYRYTGKLTHRILVTER